MQRSKHIQSCDRSGFTLMEMLIVVAIIAILIAIAIPIFTNQLKKSKVATNQSNIKAAEELCSTDYLVDGAGTADGRMYVFDTTTGSLMDLKDLGFTAVSTTYFGLNGCADATPDTLGNYNSAAAFYASRMPEVMYDGRKDTYIKNDIYQTVVVICTKQGVWACPYYDSTSGTIAHDKYATL